MSLSVQFPCERRLFPTMTFKSTEVKPAGEDRYTLIGDLSIKGNTKPVTLNLVKYGEFNDSAMGHRIGYSGEGHSDDSPWVNPGASSPKAGMVIPMPCVIVADQPEPAAPPIVPRAGLCRVPGCAAR